jgi:DNA-directed RNA polymerase III subunit RPC1
MKEDKLLTTRQFVSTCLCAYRIFLNLEMPEREYSKKGESMCPKDGWVVFRNSELICGRLGKGVLGGNKVGGSVGRGRVCVCVGGGGVVCC